MLNKTTLAAGVAIIAFSLGIMGGSAGAAYTNRHIEVANNCAHYDMETGDFTWGAKPIVVDLTKASDMDIAPNFISAGAWPMHPKSVQTRYPITQMQLEGHVSAGKPDQAYHDAHEVSLPARKPAQQ